jgi:hypothetical protein
VFIRIIKHIQAGKILSKTISCKIIHHLQQQMHGFPVIEVLRSHHCSPSSISMKKNPALVLMEIASVFRDSQTIRIAPLCLPSCLYANLFVVFVLKSQIRKLTILVSGLP